MPRIFSKIGNLVLLVIVSTLFISGTKLDLKPLTTADEDDDYTLRLTGNLNNYISGGVNFETSRVTTSKGISFSILKLKLDDKDHFLKHSMEFLIAKETSKSLSKGTYKVSSNKEGLLNYFNGVFGFANINALGELPLFAKSGEIQINHLDETRVNGIIRIQMSNGVGKSVYVKGNFVATK